MAPPNRALLSKRRRHRKTNPKPDPALASSLLAQAQHSLSQSDLDGALTAAQKALTCLTPSNSVSPSLDQLPALELLGAIHVELGNAYEARGAFAQAAQVDPDGAYAGAEKFLWLAQLSEEGGEESISWSERGCVCLRVQLAKTQAQGTNADGNNENEDIGGDTAEAIKEKLASALCGAAEVYMTDLSFEEDCEAKCEALVDEAIRVAPESPEVLQTVANVRISQGREEEARSVLERSVEAWWVEDEEENDSGYKIPDFPTRISLVRLLMEVSLCEMALQVLERLVRENDGSVEAWYLGGWCQFLLGEQGDAERGDGEARTAEEWLGGCRTWLQRCLKVYEMQEYEDERLKEHAVDLVQNIDEQIGPVQTKAGDPDDDEWEGIEDDDDNETM